MLWKYLPQGGRVLDAACGCGYGSRIIFNAGFSVVGVDRSDEAEEYSHYFDGGKTWDFRRTDLFGIEGQFDAVVTLETIEHIKEDKEWVAKAKTLAPIVIASVPNEDVTPFSPESFRHHFRHYTKSEFDSLFGNWEIKESWSQHGTKWESQGMQTNDTGRVLGLVALRP
jgi:2-polyprenyl-3-methyl-5-hydroxy-6-metoxy-1,4-benzoquinol methylase